MFEKQHVEALGVKVLELKVHNEAENEIIDLVLEKEGHEFDVRVMLAKGGVILLFDEYYYAYETIEAADKFLGVFERFLYFRLKEKVFVLTEDQLREIIRTNFL